MAANNKTAAEEEGEGSSAFAVERVVNRWLVDYYLSVAVEAFKHDRYQDFCDVRDILDNVLSRPVESTDVMPIKIKVLQFLVRINDGTKLDVSFESDESVSPLESALLILDTMSSVCDVPQAVLERIRCSIRDMLVVVFIQNKEFDKAKDVLMKHFPQSMVGKKAVFMGLVTRRSTKHPVLQQVPYGHFKQEMLLFCQSLYCPSVSFLQKAARQLQNKRLVLEPVDVPEEAEPEAQDAAPPVLQSSSISRGRLEAAYEALAEESGQQQSLSQLEVELEREAEKRVSPPAAPGPAPLRLSLSPLEGPAPLRPSLSPLEGSTAPRVPLPDAERRSWRRHHTVAQLVMEPDSQTSSPDSPASQERAPDSPQRPGPHGTALDTLGSTRSPSARLSAVGPDDPLSPVARGTTPTRKARKRQASKLRSPSARLSAVGPDDPLSPVARGTTPTRKARKRQASKLRSPSARLSAVGPDDPLSPVARGTTPTRKARKRQASKLSSSDSDEPIIADSSSDSDEPIIADSSSDSDEPIIADSSLDSSPARPACSAPKKNSNSTLKDRSNSTLKDPSKEKWKQLFNKAKESKETWSDEETLFDTGAADDNRSATNSSPRKKKWNHEETEMLKAGVTRFGEGNWTKILSAYPFVGRSSVKLKDRWRTLKKANLV